MRFHKPSPAIVISCLALFVALGGTAIAASHYVITSTSQIKPSVRRALTALGPDVSVQSSEVSVKPGAVGVAQAICPTGDHIVTGGYVTELGPGGFVAKDDPIGTVGWSVLIYNQHSSAISTMRAQALCAPGAIAVPRLDA